MFLGLHEELAHAIGNTPRGEIVEWGKSSAVRFGSVTASRVTNLGALLSRLTVGAADELVDALLALQAGRGTQHLGDRANRAVDVAHNVQESVAKVFSSLSETATQRPTEAGTVLLSLVVGFYSGAGHGQDGFGDGGIPDLDLVLGGIGWHRSIFTHSIIAGAFIETAVLALVDLVRTVHGNLPETHSPFWDEMLRYSDLASRPLVAGASLGIATHLGIDTFIDGFTPYKDLPISLPETLHQTLMGLNAAAEGAYGVSGLASGAAGGQWALHANRHPNSKGGTGMKRDGNLQQEPLHLLNLTDVKARMEAESLEERLETVGQIALGIARETGAEANGIEEALETVRRKLKAAREPFRLGIIGEFRVGKSTLVNALLGQEIAFTDIVEATATECRFTYCDTLGARILYRDGRVQELSVKEANDILDGRREDKEWLATVDHLEYAAPSERLRAFDLWDSPGLGGNDVNERVANTFLERIGGALWVFDAGLVGKASIAGPLQALKDAGKPLVCVINRADEYTGNREELVVGAERAYPGIFSAFAVISARNAFELIEKGGTDSSIETLWASVLRVMGTDEARGEAIRVERTSHVAAEDLGRAVVALRRDILDRIGLLEHLRSNLDTAKERLVTDLPAILREETEAAFADIESKVYGAVDKARGQKGDPRRAVDEIVAMLRDEKVLRAVTDRVADRSLQRLNSRWSTLTNEAINLSRIAVPISANALSSVRVSAAAGGSTKLDEQAIREGVYKGGIAAIVAGTIAAISTAVSWPVILAAIPIGALVAWRDQKQRDVGDLHQHAQSVICAMKDRFTETLVAEIKRSIEAAVEAEIEGRLKERNAQTLGAADLSSARQSEGVLNLLCEEIGFRRIDTEGRNRTAEEVLRLLQNPGSRLDILSRGIDFSLYPILVGLPASTTVRLLIAVARDDHAELSDAVALAFGNWQGSKQVRAVTTTSGLLPDEATDMLITAEQALVSDGSLAGLSDKSLRFTPYPTGRMAAQRLFAGLWEGTGAAGTSLETRSIL